MNERITENITKKSFQNEREGQIAFYNDFLPLINSELTMDDVLEDNHDGIVNGNLLEFKIIINDLNKTLFQAIKYLSSRRIKGKNVPAYIVLISLNEGLAYIYESEEYIEDIEKVYIGAASKELEGFVGGSPYKKLNYESSDLDIKELIKILRETKWTKINIDENCIVGWAERYYKEVSGATKIGFLGDSTGKTNIVGEIRKPEYFKDLIYPYKGKTNIKFDLICDRLNDNFKKKDLGAFFTPPLYAKKSHELVYEAIRRHQESGNLDYVIFDFCAGTGNLEEGLNDNVPEDIIDKNILSHCILSTYEYVEWKVLLERLGDKVRYIIPPIEKEDTFVNGLVRGNDALSEEFLNNEVIMEYVNKPNCTIIVYENPPYAETSSIEHQKKGKGKSSSTWKDNKAVIEAKDKSNKNRLKGAQSNDMANVFIWRAFEYYLRKPEDSLIVFSPLKYWKNADWLNKKFINGFAFNRRHFHTNTDTVVSCILWSNKDADIDRFKLKAFDIKPYRAKKKDQYLLDMEKEVEVKRVYSTFAQTYYDKREFKDDVIEEKNKVFKKENRKPNAIWCNYNGTETESHKKVYAPAYYNKNIVASLSSEGMTFENPAINVLLLRIRRYNGHDFILRSDNFHEKLPMFAAGWWSTYNDDWTLDGVIYRTGDGKEKYEKDLKSGKLNDWLAKVLFYTCLEYYNKIRSLNGSDGRLYVNELCLGMINEFDNEGNIIKKRETLAMQKLDELSFVPNEDEKKLIYLWNNIITEARTTKNYNPKFTYGPFQIEQELNTYKIIKEGKKKTRVYDYPLLNGNLKSLRTLIKEYYREYIQDILFEYEFLK